MVRTLDAAGVGGFGSGPKRGDMRQAMQAPDQRPQVETMQGFDDPWTACMKRGDFNTAWTVADEHL